MADTALSPRPALSDIGQSHPGAGVTIGERHSLGIAIMHVRKGLASALQERIRQHFLLELPNRPALVSAGEVAFVGIGPGAWLALSDKGGHLFSTWLRQVTAPLASINDQSGGYAVFRVGGRAIREALAKGFAIDLEARAFKVGNAATTIVSHVGATIWRREDFPDGTACFEIAVARSLAHSFWAWFSESAAEFGCDWRDAATRS
ncbi:sarcosine oxidase subunit gamma [Bradyrhizobium sp.]|uniref:sarcosine oxidase subunit gamma n=1 Tax=Bradyrhizobium sp. TaxID=376 RepID=UPI003C6023C0